MFKIKIKQIRKLKGYTQLQLAQAVGVSRSYISKMESNEYSTVNIDVLEKVIIELEINPHELFSMCDNCECKCPHKTLTNKKSPL